MSVSSISVDHYRNLIVERGFRLFLNEQNPDYSILRAVGQPMFILEDRQADVMYANEEAVALVKDNEPGTRHRLLDFATREDEQLLLEEMGKLNTQKTDGCTDISLLTGGEPCLFRVHLKLLKNLKRHKTGISLLFTNIDSIPDKHRDEADNLNNKLALLRRKVNFASIDYKNQLDPAAMTAAPYITRLLPLGENGDSAGFEKLIHPDDLPKYREALHNSQTKGADLDVEFRAMTINGKYEWMVGIGHHNSDRLRKRGTWYSSIIQNINEYKKLEQQLNNHLQRDQDATYAIAHDLRAPVRHIRMFSNILSEEIGERLNEEERYLLDTIELSAEKLGNMLDSLVQYKRLTLNPDECEWINLNVLAREVIDELNEEFDGRVEFTIVHPLPEINGVPEQIRFMLRQLLAYTASQAIQGEAATAKVCIYTKNRKGRHQILISGNGDLTERDAKKIFDIFPQVDEPTKDNVFGVGMAIVRKIVQLHGGRIWASAEVNKDNIIGFTFPESKVIDRESE